MSVQHSSIKSVGKVYPLARDAAILLELEPSQSNKARNPSRRQQLKQGAPGTTFFIIPRPPPMPTATDAMEMMIAEEETAEIRETVAGAAIQEAATGVEIQEDAAMQEDVTVVVEIQEGAVMEAVVETINSFLHCQKNNQEFLWQQ